MISSARRFLVRSTNGSSTNRHLPTVLPTALRWTPKGMLEQTSHGRWYSAQGTPNSITRTDSYLVLNHECTTSFLLYLCSNMYIDDLPSLFQLFQCDESFTLYIYIYIYIYKRSLHPTVQPQEHEEEKRKDMPANWDMESLLSEFCR